MRTSFVALFFFNFSLLRYFCQGVSTPLCFRKNVVTDQCYECSFAYFNSNKTLSTFSAAQCQARINSSSSPAKKEIFVTNTTCVTGSACNGSQSSPMDSLGKALCDAHDFSNKYSASEVNIFLLGEEHYLLRESLVFGEGYPLFKRVNITLAITPWLCSQKALTGCFDSDTKRANINLKSDGLHIFVSGELRMSRLNFRGNDLFLINDTNQNTKTDCGNQRRICCSTAFFSRSASLNGCGLVRRAIPFSLENKWKNKYGLLNLEALYDDDSSSAVRVPGLYIDNSSFTQMYVARDGLAYIALIVVGNPGGGLIELKSLNFSNMRLLKGVMWVTDFEGLYPLNTSVARVNFDSLKFKEDRRIFVSNLVLELYDNYSILKMPAGNDNSAVPVSNFQGTIVFDGFAMNKTRISDLLYTFFFFQNCSSVELRNLLLEDTANIYFLKSVNSAITLTNGTMSQITTPSLVALSLSALTMISAKFLKCTADYSSVNWFFTQDGGSFVLSKSTVQDSSNLTFYMRNCDTIKVEDCIFKDLNITNKTFFEIQAALMYFTSNIISNVSELSQNQFVHVSNVGEGNLLMNVRNVQVSGYRMKSNDSTVMYFEMQQKGSSVIVDEFSMEASLAGTVIQADSVAAIRISNLRITNMYNFYSGPVAMYLTNFETVVSENITISDLKNNYYTVYMSLCKACSISLANLTVISHEVNFNKPYFFSSSRISLKNVKIIDPTLAESLRTYFIGVEAEESSLISGLYLNFPRYPCLAIIHSTSKLSTISNVSAFGDPGLSISCKITTHDYSVREAHLSNFHLVNITGYTDQPFIENKNGILNFYGTESEFLRTPVTFEKVMLENITFLDCGSSYNGLVGVSNVMNVSIFNIKASVSSSECKRNIKGGLITINFADNVIISTLSASNLRASMGGGVYLAKISNVALHDAHFFNLSANDSAGAMFLQDISEFKGTYIFAEMSMADLKGGVFSFEGQSNIYLTNIVLKNINSTLGAGGAFYINGGSLTVSNASVFYANAESGAFIYALKSDILSLNAIVFKQGFVKNKGLFVLIEETLSLAVKNVLLQDCSAPEANGGIFIRGLTANPYILENITLANLSMQAANFLLVESGINIQIRGLWVSLVRGNLIKCSGLNQPKLSIWNLKISHCVVLDGSYLISIEYMDLEIAGAQNLFTSNVVVGSCIRAQNSILALNNINLFGNSNQLAGSDYASVELIASNSSLNNISFNVNSSSVSLGSFLTQKEGRTRLSNCKFELCRSASTACLYLENAVLELQRTSFLKSQGVLVGSIYLSSSEAFINECTFGQGASAKKAARDGFLAKQGYSLISNEILGKVSAKSRIMRLLLADIVFRITDTQSPVATFEGFDDISVSNCIFRSQDVQGQGQGLLILRSNAFFSNCSFRGLSSYAGSAIKFFTDDASELKKFGVLNSEFAENSAENGGAVLLIGSLVGNLTGNHFFNNSAKKRSDSGKGGAGGCVYFSCLNCKEAGLHLIQNEFKDNWAELHSPTVFSQAAVFLSGNQLAGNWDGLNFTNGIAALPLKTSVSNFEFKEKYYKDLLKADANDSNGGRALVSGAYFDLNITYYDSLDNKLLFSNFSQTKLSKEVNSTSAIWSENMQVAPGSSAFTSVKINSQPNSSFNLLIDIDFYEDQLLPYILEHNANNNLTLNLSTFVRPCRTGELFIKGSLSCELCKNGLYSLADPGVLNNFSAKCVQCPLSAQCSGGEMLTPLMGFWRAHKKSSLILPCQSYQSCLGNSAGFENYTEEEKVQGRCANHHSGPLCQKCERGFARIIKDGICEDCSSHVGLYFKTIVGFIFLIAYVVLQINYSLNSKSENYSNILLKQLLTHFQQLTVIGVTEFGWTSEIRSYFYFQNYLSFISENIFSFDCILQEISQYQLIKNVLVAVVLPVVLTVVILILIICFDLIFTQSLSFRNLFQQGKISLLLIVYILYPEIIRRCFSLLDCINIDNFNNTRVLRLGTDVECWTDSHEFYVLVLGLPGFLIWGVFYPLGLGIVMYSRRSRLTFETNDRTPTKNTEKSLLQTENAEPAQQNEQLKICVEVPARKELAEPPIFNGDSKKTWPRPPRKKLVRIQLSRTGKSPDSA